MADGAIWKIIHCFRNDLLNWTEYGCERVDKITGFVHEKVFYECDRETLDLHDAWEHAELARLTMRTTELVEGSKTATWQTIVDEICKSVKEVDLDSLTRKLDLFGIPKPAKLAL